MCICFENISPVSNSKWNWDCWPVMRMLPGLIKQLVLSKPIYWRMELQRSEFNICGGWLNQMLFNIQWYKQTFQMDYMKSMHAIHARWYCLHLCLWCFELCVKSEFELTYSRSKLASLVSIFKGSVTASLWKRGSRFNWAWKWKWSLSHFHSMPERKGNFNQNQQWPMLSLEVFFCFGFDTALRELPR